MARRRPGADETEGIVDRKMKFCPRLQEWEYSRLMITCKCCDTHFVHCCACDMGEWDKVVELGFEGQQLQAVWEAAVANRAATNTTCHHYRMVFVKGSSPNGGKANAVAGLGFTFGKNAECQGSLIVDEEIDSSKIPPTNKRADILAAIEGLLALSCWDTKHEKKARWSKGRGADVEGKYWVIATDSEYVVKGMTELMPKWKRNNDKNSEGREPENFDLFRALHCTILAEEAKQRVKIGFWRIPRTRNNVAGELAKKAGVRAAKTLLTPLELEELRGAVRMSRLKVEVEAQISKAKKPESKPAPVEPKSVNEATEDTAQSQDTNGKAKADNAKAGGIDPEDLSELMAKHLHMIS